uniref:Uncharacterized protein LOC103442151 isoform X1 n=1 Tax=Rhizophora mucronata TaxID=61149 RepID=A0A2P2K3R2_RHIMU
MHWLPSVHTQEGPRRESKLDYRSNGAYIFFILNVDLKLLAFHPYVPEEFISNGALIALIFGFPIGLCQSW